MGMGVQDKQICSAKKIISCTSKCDFQMWDIFTRLINFHQKILSDPCERKVSNLLRDTNVLVIGCNMSPFASPCHIWRWWKVVMPSGCWKQSSPSLALHRFSSASLEQFSNYGTGLWKRRLKDCTRSGRPRDAYLGQSKRDRFQLPHSQVLTCWCPSQGPILSHVRHSRCLRWVRQQLWLTFQCWGEVHFLIESHS